MHINKEQHDIIMGVLNESRNPDISYKETKVKGEVTKVLVELNSKKSEKFTKLINRYGQLKRAIETLTERQELENEKIKNEVADLFDAEDEVLTKVVETVTATLTLSKKQVTIATKVDYDKVLATITEMVPELEDEIKKIVAGFTTVTKSLKSPALRVTPTKTEGVIKEMAMDQLVHPKHGRLTWENNNGLHQITRASDGKVALSGTHDEIAAKWANMKKAISQSRGTGQITEDMKLEFMTEDSFISTLSSKFKELLNNVKEWSTSFSKDLANVNALLKRI